MKQLFTAVLNKIKNLVSLPPVGEVVPVQQEVTKLPEFPVKKTPAKKKPAVVAKKVAAKKASVKKSK